MLNQYYILLHIIKELRSLLGYTVLECFTQDKDSVEIRFSNGVDERYLHFSGDGASDSIFLRQNFARAKRNTSDVFALLPDEILQNVNLINNDRIIKFEFIHTNMYTVLFGRGRSNIYLCNKSDKILDTLKDKTSYIGEQLNFPKPNVKDLESFAPITTVKAALSRSIYKLTDDYADEIIARLELRDKVKLSELDAGQLNAVKTASSNFVKDLIIADAYYILSDDMKAIVSLVPLKKYPKILGEYSLLSEAIQRMSSSISKLSDFGPLYKQLEIRLDRLEKKLVRKSTDLDEAGYNQRAELYGLIGALLAGYENPKLKGLEEIELTDYSGEKLMVKLNHRQTIIENSQKYFLKAKKAKEELKARLRMLPNLDSELKRCREAQIELKNTVDMKQLEKLYMKFGHELGINFQDNKMEKEDKFRKFELDDGFVAYAGKNAANNDELTMKFAKPNDMWFHARGSSGSHVVVPLNKDQKLPKKILEQAAGVAAYYSGAKNAKYTPVAYCYKKFVRKPKGSHPGSVTIARETVILAEPKLPNSSVESS
ncbi:MAG: NFACT RNA binding domain-containing protein [bacterium]